MTCGYYQDTQGQPGVSIDVTNNSKQHIHSEGGRGGFGNSYFIRVVCYYMMYWLSGTRPDESQRLPSHNVNTQMVIQLERYKMLLKTDEDKEDDEFERRLHERKKKRRHDYMMGNLWRKIGHMLRMRENDPSHERYICCYFHVQHTNEIARTGKKSSFGCVSLLVFAYIIMLWRALLFCKCAKTLPACMHACLRVIRVTYTLLEVWSMIPERDAQTQ